MPRYYSLALAGASGDQDERRCGHGILLQAPQTKGLRREGRLKEVQYASHAQRRQSPAEMTHNDCPHQS